MTSLDHTAAPATAGSSLLFAREVSVPEGIALALEDAGIDLVLGICAGYTTPIFEALYRRPEIRTIQVRQELLGSLAANAYGRLTGKPAVISGEGEFILGTGTQGIIESLLGSAPMLILTEMFDGGRMSHHGTYHSGAGDHATYDAVGAFKAICKKVFVSHYPAQAIQHTQLAVKHALSGDPGPVAVIYHSAAFEGSVGPGSFPRIYPASGYIKELPKSVDPAAIEAAAETIQNAERPMIIAGNGVRMSKAYDSLRAFAEAADAPVVTTQGGKGTYPETGALAGGVFGEWGRESANALVGDADLIVAVGTKLGPLDTVDQIPSLIDPARQTLVQIDIDPLNSAWTLPVQHLLLGDADAVLGALARACLVTGSARAVAGADRTAAAIEQYDLPLKPTHTSDEFPLRPERLVSLIQQHWPEDGIITTDAGESRTYMLTWFKSAGGGRYLVPHGGGGMGYAIGAGLGAKIADPGRPVLAVCGDGGFPMTMNTLMNALQEGFPFAVVVFNNKALGWPLHVMSDDVKKFFEFHDFDHAAIARAMGCEGVRAESVADVAAALDAARASSVPYVIDVPITLEASFLDSTATIAKLPRERPWRAQAE
jgi:acetolactate synthase I/II/III large subunit